MMDEVMGMVREEVVVELSFVERVQRFCRLWDRNEEALGRG